MGRGVNIDAAFLRWLDEQGKEIVADSSASGGCIADSRRLELNDGSRLFIKQMPEPVSGLFKAEASGLVALARDEIVKTPGVLFQNEQCLVLEFLDAAPKVPEFVEILGRQLAELHSVPRDYFGFAGDSFCGLTRQSNEPCSNGFQFYAEQRFLYLARRCHQQGYLTSSDLLLVERLCQKLPELLPEQPPVLIHGDLWSGNVHADEEGMPVLIDPAVYYGWGEADLAMTKLFGGFSRRFYAAYQEVLSLEPGWENRMALYNLWHLLNHLLLFGESYLADVKQVIQKYA